MPDILQLPGWTATAVSHEGGELVIDGSFDAVPSACLKCGVIDGLYRHGPKYVRYRDSPVRGSPTVLRARVQRYKCQECGATFLQELDQVEPQRRMTTRCRRYIEEQALRQPFTHLAANIGCDEKTIRNIAEPHIAALDRHYDPPTPAWLGIDEVYVAGKLRCILTDVENGAPVDLLRGRTKPQLDRWLSRMPNRESVEGVAIDMWRPYRDLARQHMPQASVVVDKFHVLQMVSRGIDNVRKALRQQQTDSQRRKMMRSRHILLKRPQRLSGKQAFALDAWLRNIPELAEAYRLKEEFFGIYDMDADAAAEAIREWPQRIPSHLAPHFREITTALGNWEREILAYFHHPCTNAYTEALNGVIKNTNRQGYSYTFEALRARVLFKSHTPGRVEDAPGDGGVVRITRPTAPGTPADDLLAAGGAQCASCLGVFPDRYVLEGVCHGCRERLHDAPRLVGCR